IVCALDVTEKIELRPHHLAALARAAGSTPVEEIREEDPDGMRSQTSNPLVRHLIDAVKFYLEFHIKHDQGFLAHMHDPFAAAIALNPDLGVIRHATVDVELGGTLSRGHTIADWAG